MLAPSPDERNLPKGTLLPRYRRLLSFGDVLDEGVRLFRQHWVYFALVSAIALVPPGLAWFWLSASSPFRDPVTLAQIQSGQSRLPQATSTAIQVAGAIAAAALSLLCYCLWYGAITSTTDTYLRGRAPSLARVYGQALRRLVAILLATLLYALGLTIAGSIAVVLFVVTLAGGLAGSVPAIALLVWWLRPGARKAWLKWLIIASTPFGLLVYYATRWSMYIAAVVLEGRGPLASLRRSSELMDRQVLRVLAILIVTSLIVGVLVYAPSAIIAIPLAISSGVLDYGTGPATLITEAAAVVLRILFQSIGAIIFTMLFVDLRNRHEGTDLDERLLQLEAGSATSHG